MATVSFDATQQFGWVLAVTPEETPLPDSLMWSTAIFHCTEHLAKNPELGTEIGEKLLQIIADVSGCGKNTWKKYSSAKTAAIARDRKTHVFECILPNEDVFGPLIFAGPAYMWGTHNGTTYHTSFSQPMLEEPITATDESVTAPTLEDEDFQAKMVNVVAKNDGVIDGESHGLLVERLVRFYTNIAGTGKGAKNVGRVTDADWERLYASKLGLKKKWFEKKESTMTQASKLFLANQYMVRLNSPECVSKVKIYTLKHTYVSFVTKAIDVIGKVLEGREFDEGIGTPFKYTGAAATRGIIALAKLRTSRDLDTETADIISASTTVLMHSALAYAALEIVRVKHEALSDPFAVIPTSRKRQIEMLNFADTQSMMKLGKTSYVEAVYIIRLQSDSLAELRANDNSGSASESPSDGSDDTGF